MDKIRIGTYVVKKYQRRASIRKIGGVVISIDGEFATIYDGTKIERYLLNDMTPLRKCHTTIVGLCLNVI